MKTTNPTITESALRAIYAHAQETYPKECCGIIYGPKDENVANEAERCNNIADELHAEDPEMFPRTAHEYYAFDGADIFRMQKSLKTDKPAKLIYHSHANVGAYFSETDQAAAQMDGEPSHPVEYVVVDAQADGIKGAAQFSWSDEKKMYVEIRRYGAV
jgi:adenylyltransferase/sulfurtransferase